MFQTLFLRTLPQANSRGLPGLEKAYAFAALLRQL
jgi:hypothetical protein